MDAPSRPAACLAGGDRGLGLYAADHHVRRVSKDGYIEWRDGRMYLTEALRGETVGLARHDDDEWRIRFRGFGLAVPSDALNAILLTGRSRTGASNPGLAGG